MQAAGRRDHLDSAPRLADDTDPLLRRQLPHVGGTFRPFPIRHHHRDRCHPLYQSFNSWPPSIEPWSNALRWRCRPPVFEREQRELEPPGEPELAEDGGEVGLDGPFRDVE